MLSAWQHKEIQDILCFFKQKVERDCYIDTKIGEQEEQLSVLVIRSARVGMYINFLKELEATNQKFKLYVLGENDAAIENFHGEDKITVTYLETKGRFGIEKLEDYKRLLGDVDFQKIVYLNPSEHSCNLFNVYDVICELNSYNVEVIKYMGTKRWMKYQSFSQYVKSLKAYAASYEWYISTAELDIPLMEEKEV